MRAHSSDPRVYDVIVVVWDFVDMFKPVFPPDVGTFLRIDCMLLKSGWHDMITSKLFATRQNPDSILLFVIVFFGFQIDCCD